MLGTRVILADDHTLMLDAIKKLLEPEFEVVGTFGDGCALIEAAPALKPNVIVLDIGMPKMNGLDLHSNLSRLGKAIPTVLITAYPSDDIRARALQAGVMCYLPKPFDESDLLNCVQTALDRAKGNRGAP